MRSQSGKVLVGCVLLGLCVAGAGSAQAPQVAAPTYVTIPLEITVNRPAAEVWKRVGKFCDASEWMTAIKLPPCTIVAGKDGEIGAVRSLGGGVRCL